MVSTSSELSKYCVFEIANDLFGLPAVTIAEFVPLPELVPVPGAISSVLGICYVSNQFVPVLSLAALAGCGNESPSNTTKLILVNSPEGMWGARIDDVMAIVDLEIAINTDGRDVSAWSSAIVGTSTWSGRVVRVLDPNAMVPNVDPFRQARFGHGSLSGVAR